MESYTGTGFSGESVPVTVGGRIHLFTLLPEEAATGGQLTVKLTVCGKEFTCEVGAVAPDTNPLAAKKELKKGDKETVLDGLFTIEIVDCVYTKVLRASDYEKSQQYGGGKHYVDCILKITNNSTTDLTDIFGYILNDDEATWANTYIETENNTELESWSEPIQSGETEIIHLFAALDESEDAALRMMRFNFGGNGYYCRAA